MKLAELAAKLTLSQSEIVAFLAENETQIEEHADADLEDEHVAKVNTHFSSLKRRQRRKEAASNTSVAPSAPDSLAFSLPKDENTEDNPKSTARKVDVAPQEKAKKVVRIKAPKVALPGLKVVGKIELPQPKKKKLDETKNAPTDNDDKKQVPVKKKIKESTSYKKRVNHRPRKSRVIQQDESPPVKRRRKRSKREKEERTQRYYEKMKSYNMPIKPLRKESDADYEVYEEEKEERPKNWLSKFLHWFIAS